MKISFFLNKSSPACHDAGCDHFQEMSLHSIYRYMTQSTMGEVKTS